MEKVIKETTVEVPVIVVVLFTTLGVVGNHTVGIIVKVLLSTVDTVDKTGKIVMVVPPVVVVRMNEVNVEVIDPENVIVVVKVEPYTEVVESMLVVVVDVNPKFFTTIIVVEKLKDVRADLVNVLLEVVVVLKKLVLMENPVYIVDVLVKNLVITFKLVKKVVLVVLTMIVSVSVKNNDEVDVAIVEVVSVNLNVVSKVLTDGRVINIRVVVVKVSNKVTVDCAMG